jgi:hypothetical protein
MSSGTVTVTFGAKEVLIMVHGVTRDCPALGDVHRADAILSAMTPRGYVIADREGWKRMSTPGGRGVMLAFGTTSVGVVSPLTNLQRGLVEVGEL